MAAEPAFEIETAEGARSVDAAELRRLAAAGEISADTPLRVGGGDWKTAGAVKGWELGEASEVSSETDAFSPWTDRLLGAAVGSALTAGINAIPWFAFPPEPAPAPPAELASEQDGEVDMAAQEEEDAPETEPEPDAAVRAAVREHLHRTLHDPAYEEIEWGKAVRFEGGPQSSAAELLRAKVGTEDRSDETMPLFRAIQRMEAGEPLHYLSLRMRAKNALGNSLNRRDGYVVHDGEVVHQIPRARVETVGSSLTLAAVAEMAERGELDQYSEEVEAED